MKSKIKSIVAFIICFTLIFTTLSQASFAAEDYYVPDITYSGDASQLYTDEYNDVLFGNSWEKRYEIEVKNTRTKEVFTTVIPTTNGATINKTEFKKLLQKEFKLVKFNEYVNNNYVPSTGPVINTEEDDLSACYVESVFDVACFSMSLAEFATNPGFWTGFALVADGLSVVLPGVPAVGGLTVKAIKSSPKLKNALKYGIKPYNELSSLLSGKLWSGLKMNAHHIMPSKFASLFGVNPNKMWSIALDKYTHDAITYRFNSMFSKPASYYTNKAKVKADMKYLYQQMYWETEDYVYKFMADFIEDIDNFAP